MIQRRYLLLLLVVLSLFSLLIGVSSVTLTGLLSFDTEQWQVLMISRVPRLISILIRFVP
ncbi:hypothetical protein [Gallibacterium genomosp. 3]|uniref:hypothetical protein n=1 Tax=Gallibacterium genomosp. 3 TaxID=505345 RepID=UPI001E4F4EC7|nr:hypothetical protein [Gallibacterium genomosp. 3]